MANSPAIAKDLAAFYWWLVLLCHPGWEQETETDCEIFEQAMRPNSSLWWTDWVETKTCVYVWVCTYSIYVCTGKRGGDTFVTGTALHLYHDLNFSHLRICRLTIVTAPLAEIMRGHEKLHGCCIRNNIRQAAIGVPADALRSKRALWVGPTLVSRVILCRQVDRETSGSRQRRSGMSCSPNIEEGRGGMQKEEEKRSMKPWKDCHPSPFLLLLLFTVSV